MTKHYLRLYGSDGQRHNQAVEVAMMSQRHIKLLLRLALPATGTLPATGIIIPLLFDRSLGEATAITLITGLLVLVGAANPLFLPGILLIPLVLLYGIKWERNDPDLDLREPDAQLFLAGGMCAWIFTIGLLSILFHR
jgi:hypothetical protein